MADPVAIEPFTIAVDEAALSDLRDRIRRTRWPDHVAGSDWTYGTDPEFLRSLLATWADEFDWRERARELNRLSHYRARIDGLRVHFVHQRGNGRDPLPIVLTHGFPSSFVEHLDLLPLLTDPAAYGGRAEDAFDVVITSLPGHGFSDPPTGPMLEATVADMWCRLMRDGLGYPRFGAHGSDAGTGATIQLGRRHPEHLVGLHLSAFYLDPPPEPWPPAVREFMESSARERAGRRVLPDAVHAAPVGSALAGRPAPLAAAPPLREAETQAHRKMGGVVSPSGLEPGDAGLAAGHAVAAVAEQLRVLGGAAGIGDDARHAEGGELAGDAGAQVQPGRPAPGGGGAAGQARLDLRPQLGGHLVALPADGRPQQRVRAARRRAAPRPAPRPTGARCPPRPRPGPRARRPRPPRPDRPAGPARSRPPAPPGPARRRW